MELDLLPFTHRKGLTHELSPTYDQISRGVLWTICQGATTKYTFEVFIAALALPGATQKRGWNGVAVSMNRLNEAHSRAAGGARKYVNTKAGLDELVKLKVARIRRDRQNRNRMFSLHITIDAIMMPNQAEVVRPKKQYGQNGSTSKKGVKVPPKRGQKYPQNGGTIEERIKGEVAPRQPSPIPSTKTKPAGAQAPPEEGTAPPAAPKNTKRPWQPRDGKRPAIGGYIPPPASEQQEARAALLAQADGNKEGE
jgi:hypothetical protein